LHTFLENREAHRDDQDHRDDKKISTELIHRAGTKGDDGQQGS
jgi:hypothetical protein